MQLSDAEVEKLVERVKEECEVHPGLDQLMAVRQVVGKRIGNSNDQADACQQVLNKLLGEHVERLTPSHNQRVIGIATIIDRVPRFYYGKDLAAGAEVEARRDAMLEG